MLRDPNLIPLSQQHHNGLALCVLIRRALGEDDSPANVAKQARRAIDRYELELTNHFEIEEQILFPAIDHPLVAELIAQHREVEQIIAQLRAAPSAALLEQFCELLTGHIRREENKLFQIIQDRLAGPVLQELGASIEARVVRICL